MSIKMNIEKLASIQRNHNCSRTWSADNIFKYLRIRLSFHRGIKTTFSAFELLKWNNIVAVMMMMMMIVVVVVVVVMMMSKWLMFRQPVRWSYPESKWAVSRQLMVLNSGYWPD